MKVLGSKQSCWRENERLYKRNILLRIIKTLFWYFKVSENDGLFLKNY